MQTKDRVIATLDLPTDEGLRSSLTITTPEPEQGQQWSGYTFHILKEDGTPVTTLKLTDEQMAQVGWAWHAAQIERAGRMAEVAQGAEAVTGAA